MPRKLSEAAAWREIAESIDANPNRGLFGVLGDLLGTPAWKAANTRLRSYDCPSNSYGPEDDYAEMEGADRVLAALWLALEAESDAKAGIPERVP